MLQELDNMLSEISESEQSSTEVITNYSDDEQQQLAADAEKARQALAELLQKDSSQEQVEINTDMLQELEEALAGGSEESVSGDCPSNVYVGKQQEDGSWKTVCKE